VKAVLSARTASTHPARKEPKLFNPPSKPDVLYEYWERLNEVAEIQTEELEYRDIEWRLKWVDGEYDHYFEEE